MLRLLDNYVSKGKPKTFIACRGCNQQLKKTNIMNLGIKLS